MYSEIELFFLQNNLHLTDDELAAKLNKTKRSIISMRNKVKPIETQTNPNKTQGTIYGNAVIGNKNMSEVGDNFMKSSNTNDPDCVFRFKV